MSDHEEEHHDDGGNNDEAPDAVNCCNSCLAKVMPQSEEAKKNIVILMFEFVGTFFMTAIFIEGSLGAMFFGYFVALLMAANISGAHFNPAVTLAFMIRKENKLPKGIAFLYMLFQFMGATCGSLFAWNFLAVTGPMIGVKDQGANTAGARWYFSQAMFTEMLGGAILIFLYLTQTQECTRLAKDPAITMMLLAGGYIVAMQIGIQLSKINLSPINPAISTGIIASEVLGGKYTYAWGWIMIVFPMVGSLLGVLFFEMVYMKTQGAAKEGDHAAGDKNAGYVDDVDAGFSNTGGEIDNLLDQENNN